MTRSPARRITSTRTPPHGPLDPTGPVFREQREFAAAFAGTLNRATVAAAAGVDRPTQAGSIAALVREAYSRLAEDRRAAVRRRADRLLAGTPDQLRDVFGPHTDRLEEWAGSAGLHPELGALLKSAVRAHLDSHAVEIAQDITGHLSTTPETLGTAPKTWVKGGTSNGDASWTWTEIVLAAPAVLQFHWGTGEAGAEHGRWDLYHVQPGGVEVHLGKGLAGVPGSTWSIDLGQYLPATPPQAPQKYVVRVTPYSDPVVLPSYVEGMAGKKVPAEPVGPASKPVTITHSAVAGGPPPEFTGPVAVYTGLTCHLDSLEVAAEQDEVGDEEFHLMGFVQEIRPLSSPKGTTQAEFATSVTIDPDAKPPSKALHVHEDFALGFPVAPNWPRTYLLVVSVLEEDSGDAIGRWQADMAELSQEVLTPEIDGIIREYLEEKLDEYLEKNAQQLVNAGIDVASWIAGLVGSTAAFVVAWVAAAAAIVISGIIGGMADDYYGTATGVLVLPTNTAQYVHSLPGQHDSGAYRLDRRVIEMRGMTQWPYAAAWDGAIRVGVRWSFHDKVDYEGA
ncbi:hypothetical protein [Saccharothrix coeruleofusca]|uniref:Uncharacterized protein n=1 Tax=Saccharothrix coeruleofusca TaxID=33919 RepID=A0A918AU34_9PSEU|nr:hypothetical protein [Saccharothrix coeruleofusca]GGP76607.1 hypothetical protein GCM10010185_57940 [Saccharothrix coeruleofusca]